MKTKPTKFLFLNFNVFRKVLLGVFFLLYSHTIKTQNTVEVSLTDIDNNSMRSLMENNASQLLSSINSAYNNGVNPTYSKFMTNECFSDLIDLWQSSPFKCVETEIIEKAVKKYGGGYEIRNIPVFNSKAPKGEQNEELVLSFDSKGVIDEVLFAMDVHKWNEIFLEGKTLKDDYRTKIILHFVELFRNAYNKKDINFLSKVYSNEALIITGRVIKSQPVLDGAKSFNIPKDKVEYQKLTKAQYIANMKTIFANNSYVNVGFEDIEIVRHSWNDKMYGVSMVQNWNTSSYKDIGFLFLLIDFTESETDPMIHVRTWQPDAVQKSQRFKIDDFKTK